MKSNESSEIGISVVICSYNGKELLGETLGHLVSQVTHVPFEIILVDNASTDGTREFANQWWHDNGESQIGFSSFEEPLAGKTYAQELGFSKCRYDYILICDDDNYLSFDYLQKAYDILDQDESIGMLGGIGEAVSDQSFPSWFSMYAEMFAVGNQGQRSGDITWSKSFVYGAGCVIRKKVWNRILSKGVSLLLTCRKGDQLTAGGDNEMGYLIVASGYRVFYSSELKFQHFIKGSRLTVDYLIKLRLGYVEAQEVLKTYKSWLDNGKNTRSMKTVFFELLRSTVVFAFVGLYKIIFTEERVDYQLRYHYHRATIRKILSEYSSYTTLHKAIEKNIALILVNKR